MLAVAVGLNVIAGAPMYVCAGGGTLCVEARQSPWVLRPWSAQGIGATYDFGKLNNFYL